MKTAAASLWTDTGPALPSFPSLDRDVAADVAIVGGGITGLSLAALLAESGQRVALLERNRLASGTTARTTAHVTASLDVPYGTLVSRFGEEPARHVIESVLRAIDEIERGASRAPGACGFRRLPGFRFVERERDAKSLEDEHEHARDLGLEAELVHDVPLPFRCAQALRLERQAAFHPVAYCATLADRVVRAGGSLFEQSPVVEIGADGVRVAGGGSVRAGSVVDASHTPVGLVPSIQTRVAAWTSYVVLARLATPLAHALFWDCDDPYHYVRTVDDAGRLVLIGGEDHRTGREADPSGRLAALEAWARLRFPVESIEAGWSHELFEPADGLPYIGPLPGSRSRYVAAGFSGTGMTFGTVAALVLRDLLTRGTSPWAELYAPSRVKALASARPVAEENLRIGWRFVADRLRRRTPEPVSLDLDEGRVTRVDGEQVAIYRDLRGDLHYLSPRCTHMGCIVAWNALEKTWDCPCHGGRFHRTGKILYGPPTADLEHEKLERAADAAPDLARAGTPERE